MENLPDPDITTTSILIQVHPRFNSWQACFPWEVNGIFDLLLKQKMEWSCYRFVSRSGNKVKLFIDTYLPWYVLCDCPFVLHPVRASPLNEEFTAKYLSPPKDVVIARKFELGNPISIVHGGDRRWVRLPVQAEELAVLLEVFQHTCTKNASQNPTSCDGRSIS